MSGLRRGYGLACALVLMTTTTLAHARDPIAAEALFKEGVALHNQHREAEACDRFTRSQELDPNFITLYRIGGCFDDKRQYASAWGAFNEAANLAALAHDKAVEDAAREKANRAEKRMARLTVVVDPRLTGASIIRNGAAVSAATFNTSIPVDPGPQAITVTAPDRKAWQSTLVLREGEAGTLRVPNLEVEERPTATQSKVAVGLEIGGGVVLATGLVFGALAINTWSSVQKACPNATCPTESEKAANDSDEKRASTFAAVSTATIALGGVALITGVVLHLTSPTMRVSVTPAVDRSSCALLATLRL